jgi:hypothetical protein
LGLAAYNANGKLGPRTNAVTRPVPLNDITTNPYFMYGDITPAGEAAADSLDRWMLHVGYVYPSGSAYNSAATNVVYDLTTGLTASYNGSMQPTYTWQTGTTQALIRAYHFYNTSGDGNTKYQEIARPGIFKMDGTEPTIQSLLSNTSTGGSTKIDGASITTGKIRSNNFSTTLGSELNLNAGTIILGGSDDPKFKVDANGDVTASSALFSGSVSVTGNINATTGNIGGFAITRDAITGSGFFISGSATGNQFFISASKFNVKASGDVTGSNVLFTGGKIGGSFIDTSKIVVGPLSGRRIELNGTEASMSFFDANNNKVITLDDNVDGFLPGIDIRNGILQITSSIALVGTNDAIFYIKASNVGPAASDKIGAFIGISDSELDDNWSDYSGTANAIAGSGKCAETCFVGGTKVGLMVTAQATKDTSNIAANNAYGIISEAQVTDVHSTAYSFYGTGVFQNTGDLLIDGNVGIGTTTPNAKLDISGSVNISGSGVQVPLQVSSGNTSLLFVSGSGKVGIGTTTPECSLQVVGGIRARGGTPAPFGANNNGYAFSGGGGDSDSGMYSEADGEISFYSNNSKIFQIQGGAVKMTYLTGDGTVVTTGGTGTLSVSSDSNLKDADGFVENGLEKVLALKPRYFYWKDKEQFGDNRQLGFFAQEVNAVSEETAKTPAEGGGWGIYDRGLLALLTAAIQEQNQTIQDLKTRIQTLENK